MAPTDPDAPEAPGESLGSGIVLLDEVARMPPREQPGYSVDGVTCAE